MDILKCTVTNDIERSNAIIILAIKTTQRFVYKSNKNERGLGTSIHCSSANGMNAHMLALNWPQIPNETSSNYDEMQMKSS